MLYKMRQNTPGQTTALTDSVQALVRHFLHHGFTVFPVLGIHRLHLFLQGLRVGAATRRDVRVCALVCTHGGVYQVPLPRGREPDRVSPLVRKTAGHGVCWLRYRVACCAWTPTPSGMANTRARYRTQGRHCTGNRYHSITLYRTHTHTHTLEYLCFELPIHIVVLAADNFCRIVKNNLEWFRETYRGTTHAARRRCVMEALSIRRLPWHTAKALRHQALACLRGWGLPWCGRVGSGGALEACSDGRVDAQKTRAGRQQGLSAWRGTGAF